MIFYILRVQQGSNLRDILMVAPDEHDEIRWERLKETDDTESPPLRHLCQWNFPQLKMVALRNIQTLQRNGWLSLDSDYQIFLNELAHDYRAKAELYNSVHEHISEAQKSLNFELSRSRSLEEELRILDKSFDSSLQSLGNKRGRMRFLNPFSHQSRHQIRNIIQGNTPRFGSFAFTALYLEDKHISIQWGSHIPLTGVLNRKQLLRELEIIISSNEANVYEMEGLKNSTIVPGATASFTWNQLAEAQHDKAPYLYYFESSHQGALVVDTVAFIALIARKFWAD